MEKSKQNTVIFDNGSLNTRIGFSSKDKPQFTFQTSTTKNNETVFPVKTGIIVDFEAMESIWSKSFSKLVNFFYLFSAFFLTIFSFFTKIFSLRDGLNVDPKEHGVVLTESVLAPKMQRELVCQYMFEKFNVPYLYIAPSPLFSLYSVGKKSGVVVDIGDSTTIVAPVAEGSLITHAVEKIEFGGRDITHYLQAALNKTYGQTVVSYEEANKIKEKFLYVPKDYQSSLTAIERLSKKSQTQAASDSASDQKAAKQQQQQKGVTALFQPQEYTLPDGKTISVDPKLRFEILEYSLFAPPTTLQPSFFEKWFYPPETYFKEKRTQALNSLISQNQQKKGFIPQQYFSNDNNPKEHDGLHRLVYTSIMKSSPEYRKALLGNVILGGGSSMFDGLQHRLATELELISNTSYQPTKVYLAANGGAVTAGDTSRAFGMAQSEDYAWGSSEGYERAYSSWAGASIFTQLSSFQNICIRKSEYNEHGPAFIHRKTM